MHLDLDLDIFLCWVRLKRWPGGTFNCNNYIMYYLIAFGLLLVPHIYICCISAFMSVVSADCCYHIVTVNLTDTYHQQCVPCVISTTLTQPSTQVRRECVCENGKTKPSLCFTALLCWLCLRASGTGLTAPQVSSPSMTERS